MRQDGKLSGKRILIAEDNFLIALDLHNMIEKASGTAVIAASNHDALKMLEGIDAAIVDANLRDGDVRPLAAELEDRALPFMILSGYASETLPPPLRALPFLAKPYQETDIVELAGRIIAGRDCPSNRLAEVPISLERLSPWTPAHGRSP